MNAVFTAQKYDLIERAAQVVCDAILENYPKVQSVTVELKKPEAPIPADETPFRLFLRGLIRLPRITRYAVYYESFSYSIPIPNQYMLEREKSD